MPEPGAAHQFFLSFDTVDEFDEAFERRGSDTGFFFHLHRSLTVGKRVSILVSIKDNKTPVVLEGRVIWRRVQDGGKKMPPGVFVGLVDRDRARLDAIVHYLRAPGKRKERRSHFRYPVYLDGTYATTEGEFPSETRNLSRGGAFLHCMGPLLTVGAHFPLVLHLDGKTKKGTSLNARVAWIDYFEETQGMGIAFLTDQAQCKKVQRLLERHRKKMKQRGPS